MRQTLAILVLLVTAPVFTQPDTKADNYYPSIIKVLDHLFANYQFTENTIDGKLNLVKDTQGWSIEIMEYDSDDARYVPRDREMLWSFGSGEFLRVNLPGGTTNVTPTLKKRLLHDYSSEYYYFRNYSMNAYYGYEGWSKDVVTAFAGREDEITNDELYSLARAYGDLADEYGSRTKTFRESSDPVIMDEEGINQFVKHINLKADALELLIERDPNHEVLLGDPDLEHASDVMDGYLTLRYLTDIETARQMIRYDLYSDFVRTMAMNYLSSCPQNAILFTNGDNDTYPLLYVQEVYNFRKDVTVANLSLLNIPEYLDQLRRDEGAGALPVEFSLESSFYYDLVGKFVEFREDEYPIELGLGLKFVRDPENVAVSKFTGTEVPYLPSKNFFIEYDQAAIPSDPIGEVVDVIEWSLEKSYLIMGELALLDIIKSNYDHRPICFTTTVGRDVLLGLQDHLVTRGFATELQPVDAPESLYSPVLFNLDTSVIHDQLFSRFTYPTDWSIQCDPCMFAERFGGNYRVLLEEYASVRAARGDTTGAIALILFGNDKLPADHVRHSTVSVLNAITLAELGAAEEGDELVVDAIEDIFDQLKSRFKKDHLLAHDWEQLQNDFDNFIVLLDMVIKCDHFNTHIFTWKKYGEKLTVLLQNKQQEWDAE